MATDSGVILDYERKRLRRPMPRWVRYVPAVLLAAVVLIFLARVAVVRISANLERRAAAAAYLQRQQRAAAWYAQSLNFSLPPSQMAWEDDAARHGPWNWDLNLYETRPSGTGLRCPAPVAAMMRELNINDYRRPGTTVFAHGRTPRGAGPSSAQLVLIEFHGAHFNRPFKLDAPTWAFSGTCFLPSGRGTIDMHTWGDIEVDVSLLGGAHAHGVRLFAGQPDPLDGSHFTIRYETDLGPGTLYGWLLSDGHLWLEVRDGPALPDDAP